MICVYVRRRKTPMLLTKRQRVVTLQQRSVSNTPLYLCKWPYLDTIQYGLYRVDFVSAYFHCDITGIREYVNEMKCRLETCALMDAKSQFMSIMQLYDIENILFTFIKFVKYFNTYQYYNSLCFELNQVYGLKCISILKHSVKISKE